MHGGAVGLRLVEAVSEALEDRQLHRRVLIAQSLIELERVRDRHARVLIAVLDQRRRVRLLDVGHRRGVRIDLRIVPGRRLQVLPRERMNVGVDVVRHPVGDAGADRDRLEAIGMPGRQERRDVTALAPAHAADAIAIGQPLLHQRVDARQHVPRVADAEIADVERPELLAVAGAAAIVRLEHQRALRQECVDGVGGAAAVRHRARNAGRAAVNHDQQRIAPARHEVGRLVQHPFDAGAVLALPGDHFAGVLRPRRDLRAEVADFRGGHRLQLRDVDVGEFRCARADEGRGRAVTRQREAAAAPLIADRVLGDLLGVRIQREEVSPGPLRGRELDT